MALFQKNPYSSDVGKQLYSFGHEKTMLIVGLGNVGEKYQLTRHNAGFLCVDYFAEKNDFPNWIDKKDLKAQLTKKTLGETQVIIIKPTTMMNLSGEAVQATARFYKIPDQQIVVVHDELDVKFGKIRTRMGGGAAGHNGIKSLQQHLSDEFGRVRIGVDSPENQTDLPAGRQVDSADYVLAKFTDEEQKQLPPMQQEVSSILTETIYSGQLTTETRQFLL